MAQASSMRARNSIELMLSLSGSGRSRLKEGASAMEERRAKVDGATFRDGQ